jgi:hypothetical protein
MTQCRADTVSFLFSDIKSENFKKNKWEKNDTKSVFFPYKNYRPTVRKIPDIVTADTKSGCRQKGKITDCYPRHMIRGAKNLPQTALYRETNEDRFYQCI